VPSAQPLDGRAGLWEGGHPTTRDHGERQPKALSGTCLSNRPGVRNSRREERGA
jgi:hypothetical protein